MIVFFADVVQIIDVTINSVLSDLYFFSKKLRSVSLSVNILSGIIL